MPDTQPPPAQPTPPKPTADRIHLTVRNRKKVIFDEDVRAVTSRNDTGIFDVLPEHANFISLIDKSITVKKMDGQQQIIPIISGGVIKVKDNGIHCYLDLLSVEGEKEENKPTS